MRIQSLAVLLFASLTAQAAGSGIDQSNFDRSVRPQDDFYRFVNGQWLKTTKIPADKSNYGTFQKLHDSAQLQLRAIIDEASSSTFPAGSDMQKLGDLYRSFMDETRVEQRGLQALDRELLKIDLVSEKSQLPKLFGQLMRIGADLPFGGYLNQDARDPDNYIVYLYQDGLGLPDRDYYLADDAKFRELRGVYRNHVARMLRLAGTPRADKVAADILAFETQLAQAHWTKVESRDAEKTYNKYSLNSINSLSKGFDLSTALITTGIDPKYSVVVRQPSYYQGLADAITATKMDTLREYFRFHLISSFAPYLSEDFVSADFEMYGKALSGTEENRPRWKRGVRFVESSLGDVLGRIYVERHFPPQAKARMQTLVGNLIKAYRRSISALDWMSEDTRAQALEKLSKFRTKIGYPDSWKSYAALTVRADDLLGNRIRSNIVEHERELAKLGAPINRDEWFMFPQTVNAYYNPVGNEIVFPAAILQPPFFNFEADDAANYGAIGAVIGHEIGHGFDDQGSRFDGDGSLRNWWTDDDRKRFEQRTRILIDQYSAYEPLPGLRLNGELTIGENIGDLGGLSIAFNAWKHSLGGKRSPDIDSLSGNQRFFMGWAQAWQRLYREDEMIKRLKTDPHSPSEFRCNGVVANMPVFYETFGVVAGDKLYRPPELRVRIW